MSEYLKVHYKEWVERTIKESKNENIKYVECPLQVLETLQQENKILRENAENNDKVVNKVNWENNKIQQKNEQLQQRINKATEYIKEFSWYYAKDDGTKGFVIEEEKEETFVNELLEILKGKE